MPVYEYVCRTCNTRHDKLRPAREADAPVMCPSCREQNSIRMLSTFAMHTGSRSEARSTATESHSGGCSGGCAGCSGCGHTH
jgi:putative FmdB family regulatory protein